MKLNIKQSLAIAHYLLINSLILDHNLIELGDLFNEETNELRVIHPYGMAGKIWNSGNEIYITGWSPRELNKNDFKRQQLKIEEINKDIKDLIESYK